MFKNNMLLIGPPGSGKTYNAKLEVVKTIWNLHEDTIRQLELSNSRFYNPKNFCNKAFNYIVENYKPQIRFVSMHEGMTINDLIEGIQMHVINGIANYQSEGKIVPQLINEINSQENSWKLPGFLILDDINRINASSVLGELLYAFNNRDTEVTLSSGNKLCIPGNLYVIATMNSLQPQYNLDFSMLNGFEIRYMQSNIEILNSALNDGFLKSAYYNVDSETTNELIDSIDKWNKLIDEIEVSGACLPNFTNSDLGKYFNDFPDYSCYKLSENINSYMDIKFPLIWEKQALRVAQYTKSVNELGQHICGLANEFDELFSKLYSRQTEAYITEIKEKIRMEYTHYNKDIENIVPELQEQKENYSIGYSYFLPGDTYSVWNAIDLVQNKIRAQVQPLLRQYAIEGIIDRSSTASVERTYTLYSRDSSAVREERIIISSNDMYKRIFDDIYINGASSDQYKDPVNRSQPYNTTYGLLYEIVLEIIAHNLINYWDIMEMLSSDNEIFLKVDPTGRYAGYLLAPSKMSEKIITGGTDTTRGNQSLTSYRKDLHNFFYKGQKYLLLSKLGLDTNANFKTIEQCKLTGPVTARYRNVYPIAKLMIYKYLMKFKQNLEQYLRFSDDQEERSKIIIELQQLSEDLQVIENIRWEGLNHDERRRNFLTVVRNLPTWEGMLNGNLKGVYKIMDDRYQIVMESTGIHQMILQGPPGTSKTYGAKEFLCLQAGIINQNGECWKESDLKTRQLLPDGDNYKLPTENLKGSKDIFWDIIQFHPSYTYEDFVRGIAVTTNGSSGATVVGKILENEAEKYNMNLQMPTSIIYKTVNRTLGKMAQIAKEHYNEQNPETSKKFYLVVDEINRANLATVFGELIYALEYRNSDVATPYEVGNDNKLRIPSNLYIIGTMNTADKSIGSIDYAIRRRFLFFPILPDIKVVFDSLQGDSWENSNEVKLYYTLEKLFDAYLNVDDYNKYDVQVGHTYFIRKDAAGIEGEEDTEKLTRFNNQMKNRFLYQVIPVLREYKNDGILIYEEKIESSDVEIQIFDTIKSMIEISDLNILESKYEELIKYIEEDFFINDLKNYLSERKIIAIENDEEESSETEEGATDNGQ